MSRRPAVPTESKSDTPKSTLHTPDRADAPTAGAAPATRVTLRSVLIGLLLIPANAWWLAQIEYVRYTDNATTSSLFFNAIALLLTLLALNALLGRTLPRAVLAPGELVVIYVMVVVGSNLAGHDQLQILFTTISYVVRRSTPGSPLDQRLMPHVPSHL